MATCCFICVYSFESFVVLQSYGLWCVQRLLRTEISFMVRGLTRDTAINQVDSPLYETNSDSCGSRAAYGYPPKQASAAHSRSAECFCQRLQHSHFTTLEVIVLRLASAKPDRVCGAGMRRSGAEGRSPKAIAKRYASTRARTSIIGVYQPLSLPGQ